MSRLTIVVDVPALDPALVDPHEIAQDVVDAYNEWSQANGIHDPFDFVGAEWGHLLEIPGR